MTKPTAAQQIKWYKALIKYNKKKMEKKLKHLNTLTFELKQEKFEREKIEILHHKKFPSLNIEKFFYMVEFPENIESFTVFKNLEDAVQTIKTNRKYKWANYKILSLTKTLKGLEVEQISWADILEVIA